VALNLMKEAQSVVLNHDGLAFDSALNLAEPTLDLEDQIIFMIQAKIR